ncbi:MAG: hypothetical protein WCJ84_04875 [Candidatus Peregrinibacteria bacterium]
MNMIIDIIDGKIEVPTPWKNAKRLRIRKQKDSYILTPEDDTPEGLKDENVELYESIEDGEKVSGIHFKKGLGKEGMEYFMRYLRTNA